NGNVWFSEEQIFPHSIGYVTPAGAVTKFQVPCARCADGSELIYIDGLAVAPDGKAWFNYTHVGGDGSPLDGGFNNFIGRYTREGTFASFPLATKDGFRRFVAGSFGHSAITAGPDGNMWFTENSGNKVGKITPNGTITEFVLPAFFSSPSGITSGPDGNLWFTETSSNKIGRITTAGALTEFALGSGRSPLGITSAPDGNLWFTEQLAARIGRITPAGAFTEFSTDAAPIHIMAGPDSNLWFTASSP